MKLIDRYKERAQLGEYEIAGMRALNEQNSEKSLRVAMDNVLQARTHVMRENRPRGTLTRPVFIIGMPRSGGSFLQNALAQIDGIRVPETWEARYQAPPRHANPMDDIRRIRTAREAAHNAISAKVGAMLVGGRSPLSGASDSEIMTNTFWSPVWGTMFNWQTYFSRWLEQDMRPALRYHRRLLEEWDYYRPGSRMVLRDNWHQFHMDDLREVYPDATFIQMVRDPETCIRKFYATMRVINPSCGTLDDFRQVWNYDHSADIDAHITVATDSLSTDPIETVMFVCDSLGITVSPHSENRLATWLEGLFRARSPLCPSQ